MSQLSTVGRGYSRRDLGFIDWAKKQIELYAEIFRKQVYSSDVDQQTVEEALRITHSQSRKVRELFSHAMHSLTAMQLLQEFGLDFRYLLDDLLVQHPKPPSISTLPNMPPRLAISPPSLSRTSDSPSPSPSVANPPSTPTSRLRRPSLSRGDSSSVPSTPVRPALPRSVDSVRPPPPRSMNRPSGSAARPVPVAIPQREGMI